MSVDALKPTILSRIAKYNAIVIEESTANLRQSQHYESRFNVTDLQQKSRAIFLWSC